MLLTALLVAAAAAAGDGAVVLQKHEGPMAKVLEAAREKGRPVLLDFFTEW